MPIAVKKAIIKWFIRLWPLGGPNHAGPYVFFVVWVVVNNATSCADAVQMLFSENYLDVQSHIKSLENLHEKWYRSIVASYGYWCCMKQCFIAFVSLPGSFQTQSQFPAENHFVSAIKPEHSKIMSLSCIIAWFKIIQPKRYHNPKSEKKCGRLILFRAGL